MIKRLLITEVNYRLESDPDDAPDRNARFFGRTSSHQFMRLLMEQHPGQVVRITGYTQANKVYQIDEEEFIKIAKEIEE